MFNPEDFKDGAYVKYSPELGVFFVWYGGHMVHIHTEDGREVDVFTMGNCAKDVVDIYEAIEAIDQHIEDFIKEEDRTLW